MVRHGATLLSVVIVFTAGCTSNGSEPTVVPDAKTPHPTPSTVPLATLVHGEPLPAGCHGGDPSRNDTVAFVAQGRAWALPPAGQGAPVCLFATADPGPFAWGPQGDRVALGGLAVRGVAADAPSLPTVDAESAVLGWGRPLGLAMVFASGADRIPRKRFVDDGRVERLNALPHGHYLQVTYHPSGLALAFVIERNGEQSIWLSSNEGLDPTRLVFSHGGTTFPSIAFTPDGSRLTWIAHHVAGYAQVHSMDLAKRDGFSDDWQTEQDGTAANLVLPPGGTLMALDEGAGCADRTAMVVFSPTVARPAVPDETRPTTAIGWLDRDTLLVAAGRCGGPLDLYTVDALSQGGPTLVVTGAIAAASRAPEPPAPSEVPHPQDEEPPPGGVG
jgi:hypothetical protein